jgi:PmbA protein
MAGETERILSEALLVSDAAEVYSEISTATTVSFQANRCHSVETTLTRGVGLRLVRDGHLGFASGTNLDRVDELVEAASETARLGGRAEFRFPAPAELPSTAIESNRITLLPPGRMLKLGGDIIQLCEQQIPGIKIDLSIHRTATEIQLVNSQGFDRAYDKTTCYLSFEGLLVKDYSFIWLDDFLNLSRELKVDPVAFARHLAQLARQAQSPARLKTGRYPCIFIQTAGIDLLTALLPGVNGKSLQKNMSPLIDKENKKLFDTRLTVWDDGLADYGFGTAPFDGEGVPQRKTALIEGGIFRNFLLDLRTAAATGRESTGNASRVYRSMPVPGMTNIVVEQGDLSLEQTIAGIDEGVLIYAAVGGGQSNLLAGDFSVNISLGFKIEHGEVTGRVKDAMVAGNIYEIGKKLVGLGDTIYDYGGFQLPFLMFDDLLIAARR